MTHEKDNEEIVRKLIRNIDYAKRKGKEEKLNLVFVHEEYRKILSALNEIEEVVYHSKHYNGVLVIGRNNNLEELKRKLKIRLGEKMKIGGTSYSGSDNFLSKQSPNLLIGKAMKG